MKKKLFLMLPMALVLFVVASCSKDQKAVKTLSGTWVLVSADGEAVSTAGEDKVTYTFDECKLKKDEYCDLTIKDSDGTESGTYRVTDDGETLVLRSKLGDVEIELSNKIIELTDDKLELEFNFAGLITLLVFEKE